MYWTKNYILDVWYIFKETFVLYLGNNIKKCIVEIFIHVKMAVIYLYRLNCYLK